MGIKNIKFIKKGGAIVGFEVRETITKEELQERYPDKYSELFPDEMPKRLTKMPEPVKFEDLVGLHKLTGVDLNSIEVKEDYGEGFEPAECISIELDGKVYTAIEDPSDGYRSSMSTFGLSRVKLKNKFPSQKVLARIRTKGHYNECYILELINIKTGEVIVEIGTDNSDDYYPRFVSAFDPAKLSINKKKK